MFASEWWHAFAELGSMPCAFFARNMRRASFASSKIRDLRTTNMKKNIPAVPMSKNHGIPVMVMSFRGFRGPRRLAKAAREKDRQNTQTQI